MPKVRGNFADLLDPAIRTILFDRFNELPEKRPMVFNEKTSDRNQEIDSAVTGLGIMPQTDELGPLQYEDANKMYKTVYTHLKYMKGIRISRELLDDDQHNVITRMPKALAQSVNYTTEFWGASVLNNAFTAANTSYGDGKPLISTAHPRSDGGTAQSNTLDGGTQSALAEQILEDMSIVIENALNDKGMRVSFQPNRIIVPLQLRKLAKEIIGSTLKQGTPNNDKNVQMDDYEIVTWNYLTSSTAWFMQDSNNHELNWYWRARPEMMSEMDFDSDASKHRVKIRFSYGWSDWRGFAGSKGDASTYSG